MLRDAHALVPRAELDVRLGDDLSTAFVGFRGDSLSLYFGDDPVFHFNAQGQLRRAFVGDQLIKAEQGRLVGLQPQRSSDAVTLLSRELDESAQRQVLEDLQRRLTRLGAALAGGGVSVRGQVPPDGDAVERLRAWLEMHSGQTVAASPRVN